MKNRKTRIVGLDFFKTKSDPNMTVSVVPLAGVTGAGLEDQIVQGTDVLLKNISASQYRDLLDGKAYLEFWIEAIDHNVPTANNRLYTEEEFLKGMEKVLRKVIKKGGLQPGEHKHPPVTFNPKLSEKENMAIISARLMDFDNKSISHYVCDTDTRGGKTYFKIRTNPSYPVIVKEISLGKIPTFSIRTLGDFPLVNGVNRGENLLVITTDYVYNPANADSKPLASNMKFVDPMKAEKVDIQLTQKVGNESVELFKLAEGEELVIAMESDNTFTMNIVDKNPSFDEKALTNEVFASIF